MPTFKINWIDPVANFASVTFSDNSKNPVSVPITKTATEDVWQQEISDWYNANLPTVADVPKAAFQILPKSVKK